MSARHAGPVQDRVQKRRPRPVARLERLEQDQFAGAGAEPVRGHAQPAVAVRRQQAGQLGHAVERAAAYDVG